ncbi:hypothetical protein ROJ8625_03350 [Roseivivax jejudonensis]|uniref:Uncharacterized protein n=1 Tax=Roseivivax jejudonensis TaxID=1529041 RepID=A0A1X6ZYV9_9RHOB|nr:hypothetical protein [Roseivivax jejudonensis]SLN65563.1 hypothetical protein ROJ8625_03350 [Roseivivax jejudonensis]
MDELRQPDFPVRWVVATIAASLALLCIAVAVVYFGYTGARPASYPAPDDFGAPQLETAPVANFDAWRAEQRALMNGAEGRTPIEEAMQIIAERGAAAYDPLPAPTEGPR